jgi:phage gp36-like protein
MATHTKTDIARTIPEYTLTALTDDEGMNVADQDIIDEIIAQTDGEIEAYVSLDSSPALLRSIGCRISIYKLYSRKHDEIPESRRLDYKDAVKQLESLRDSLIKTGGTAAVSSGYAGGVVVTERS